MNDSNNNAKTMYETVSAAAELNKIPGFDPLKFLRRTKDTLKLDLPYQKLWFRMAHPNGRMRVTALRITEQMAIFEARVFLDRSDVEPFSMSVAQQSEQDNQNFVQAAQNEALSQALTDAGFGIQLMSANAQAGYKQEHTATPNGQRQQNEVTQAAHLTPPEKPVSAPQKAAASEKENYPAQRIKTQQGASEAAETAKVAEIDAEASVAVPEEQSLPVEPVKKVAPHENYTAPANGLPVGAHTENSLLVQKSENALPADEPAQETSVFETVKEVKDTTPASTYTQDMPVEDILKVMTLEQAQQVVVDDGICRGMTIAQVAEKRPVNLRFYLIPGKSKNNMVRAAAQLVLDSIQKAG